MPWVRFAAPFDWNPPGVRGWTRAYPAGAVAFVTRLCAERAIAAGKAVPAERPAR